MKDSGDEKGHYAFAEVAFSTHLQQARCLVTGYEDAAAVWIARPGIALTLFMGDGCIQNDKPAAARCIFQVKLV